MLLYFLLGICVYFFFRGLMKKLEESIEKLEEYNGEFIYTYLSSFMKKEMYFSITEIVTASFKVLSISANEIKNMSIIIFLEDNTRINLSQRENIIIFFRSLKENNISLYENILENGGFFSKAMTIFSGSAMLSLKEIMDKEIENYKK